MSPPKRKKAKPRWGAHFQYEEIDIDGFIDDDKVTAIARLLESPQFSKTNDFAQCLVHTYEAYWTARNFEDVPSKAEKLAALEELIETANALRDRMQRLDDWSRLDFSSRLVQIAAERDSDLKRIINTQPVELDISERNYEARNYDNYIRILDEIRTAADQAVEIVNRHGEKERPRGRRPNEALYGLIADLYGIYSLSIKSGYRLTYDPIEETYRGLFFKLVRTFLDMIDPENRITDLALGDAIRRALGKRR